MSVLPPSPSYIPSDYINDDIGRVASRRSDVNRDVVRKDVAIYDGIMTMVDMEEGQPPSGHSFGGFLRRLRIKRGLSIRGLELASSVANIPLMERGKRGVPRPRAVYDLVDALKCTPEERLLLYERALGDRILKEIQDFAGYLFLSLVRDGDIHKALDSLEPLSAIDSTQDTSDAMKTEAAIDLLQAVARDSEYSEQREWLAEHIFSRLTVDLQNGEVVARLAPFAANLLGARHLHDEEAGVQATGAEEAS